MERHVKERLVGAAVLMAAAIILIPEMLSGPDRAEVESAPSAAAGTDTPIKTYTIDLSQSPGEVAANLVEERAAPPEDVSPLATAPALGDPAAEIQAQTETSVESSPAANPPGGSPPRAVQEASPQVVESTTPTARVPVKPRTETPASASAAPVSGGWAVQLGSFSQQATAERVRRELRTDGHDAFVMPVKSGAATLYRVRIGPMQERSSAEAVLRRVKAETPGATVVVHP